MGKPCGSPCNCPPTGRGRCPRITAGTGIEFHLDVRDGAVEPGPFDVYVGDSSVGGLHGQFTVH